MQKQKRKRVLNRKQKLHLLNQKLRQHQNPNQNRSHKFAGNATIRRFEYENVEGLFFAFSRRLCIDDVDHSYRSTIDSVYLAFDLEAGSI